MNDTLNEIGRLKTPNSRNNDKLIWLGENSSNFLVKNAYTLTAVENRDNIHDPFGK